MQALSAIAINTLRAQDTAGRWGGEEFLVLLPKTCATQAMELGETLRHNLGEHAFADGLRCTVSIGVAEMRTADTPDNLIHRADTALYQAKKEGKNRVILG